MLLARLAILGLMVYAAAVGETSLVDVLEVRQIAPSLIALAAIALPLVSSSPYAFLGAGVIALAGDLFATGRVGMGAAAMLLVAYGVGRLRHRMPVEHYALHVPVVFVATAVWVASTGVLRAMAGESAVGGWTLLGQSVWVGAYTAALALPVLMVVAWLREPAAADVRRLEGG